MSGGQFIPYLDPRRIKPEDMLPRAQAFKEEMGLRRTIRDFSTSPVDSLVIDECIRAAMTAPSGANQQPWHFVVIRDQNKRRQIRLAAEKEEYEFYHHRATAEWLEALAPLGTNPEKPFLEDAPFLIAIFVQAYGISEDGNRRKHYYATESVGIAAGILIAALHHAGLATLTHTPSPMGFLNQLLDRPPNERPFLLLVTGYPKENALVPVITKKSLEETTTYF